MPLDYTSPIRVKGTHEKVEILRTDLPGMLPILALVTYNDREPAAHTFPANFLSWENIPAPNLSGTVWVNVYEGGRTTHESREQAEYVASLFKDGRLACVELHWTEGEGL